MHRTTSLVVVAAACGSQAPAAREQPPSAVARVDHWASTPDGGVPADAGPRCVGAGEAAPPLTHVRQMLDSAAPRERGEPTLVTDACTKLVYEYGEYRVVIRRNADGKINASSYLPATSTACLDEKTERAMKLLPYARVIIEKGRRHFGDEWNEPDIGIARWADCSSPAFGTLLHEVNHALRAGECIHDPSGEPLCFEGFDSLPPRSYAHAPVPIKDPALRKVYEQTRDTYLAGPAGDDSVVLWLDELLAYGIAAEAEAAIVSAGHRSDSAILLPLVAYLNVHYWDKLRRDSPDVFERALGARTKNRAAFERLLARTEAAYATWLDVRTTRTAAMAAVTRGEDALWKEYLAAKKRVLR